MFWSAVSQEKKMKENPPLLYTFLMATCFMFNADHKQGDENQSKEWERVLPGGCDCTNPQIPEDRADTAQFTIC